MNKDLKKIKELTRCKAKCVVACVLFVIYFSTYQTDLSHIIFYNEEHRLFRFSTEYLSHRFHWDGVLSVITDFLCQFFYLPALGSVLLSLLLTGIYLMANALIQMTTRRKDFLQLSVIPSAAAFLWTCEVERRLEYIILSFLLLALLYIIIKLTFLLSNHNREMVKTRPHIAIAVTALAIYSAAGYYLFWNHYNYNERRLLLVSHLAKEGDWENVLRYTENYFQAGRTNNMMTYYYGMALWNKGLLADGFMQYNQAIGPTGLYLAWQGSREDCEYGYLLYEQLGLLNMAQRWEFESMVTWGETAPHLINLARYNIANNQPVIAKKFIGILKQTLFYRDEAKRLEEATETGEVKGLRNPLLNVTDVPASFMKPTEFIPNLEYLLEHDPKNKMAYEYLMCSLILNNQSESFLKWFGKAPDFYDKIPETFTAAKNYFEKQ